MSEAATGATTTTDETEQFATATSTTPSITDETNQFATAGGESGDQVDTGSPILPTLT